MKYIRTKDGIYRNASVEKNITIICENRELIVNPTIIKQADTIEELCDMFVVWQEGCNMPVDMPLTEKDQYDKMKKVVSAGMKVKMNIWLKCAIWTDKGLIYVAKMNDKGELELL